RYDVQVLLLTEQQVRPLRARGELSSEKWAVVYWDDWCAVFVRRFPRFREVLERHEYRQFPPFPAPPDLKRLRLDPERLREARTELTRVLARNPDSQRALYYRGLVSLHQGDLRDAKRDLEQAARIRPDAVIDRVLLEVASRLLRKG
ncbi:MAG: tetratricopeptide repeat protein, partial [Candidatus Binatia bacterium]